MPSRLRFASVLLVATLIVVAGYSMLSTRSLNYLLVGLLLLFVLFMAILFYKKRDAMPRLFAPFLTRVQII